MASNFRCYFEYLRGCVKKRLQTIRKLVDKTVVSDPKEYYDDSDVSRYYCNQVMSEIFGSISAFLEGNSSLKFGYEWDRDYFVPLLMTQQQYMPIIGSLTLHPIVFYLLLFDHRTMVYEIRIGYFFLYLMLVLEEWLFCFAFRVYMLAPYAAFYCEGPLCKSGWDTHLLMHNVVHFWVIFSVPVILINSPFDFLVVRLHQMFVPVGNAMKFSKHVLVIMYSLHSMLMVLNIVAWGISGKECDESELLKAEPELNWLIDRGGNIFMFGAPGDPEYFGKALILFAVTISIISPVILFLTLDAMRRVAKTNSRTVSSGTQAASRRMLQVFFAQAAVAAVNYVAPLFIMFTFMVIDGSWIPGRILSLIVRFIAVVGYNTKSYVFGIFLLFKNPNYRKFLINKSKRLIGKGSEETKLTFVLGEWVFCFAFRMYPLAPYSALYCEEPMCRSGWNRQWLMGRLQLLIRKCSIIAVLFITSLFYAIFSFPIIIANTSFDSLVVMLHQMFMPVGSKLKLSKWLD
ncbi:hypothetical protein PRIPAC_79906 [Pristionchus pacificus]|uniref:G protein-coupled receptor n=1 Tax=Pristionchus pacificus TaxID=54126 RepID=A0A2A6C218_PRIPA|nr:hypothetical protein PRIPAC_79906 [Pristionchus pacificus]|eukprot:PDM72190.1 G protein-coupled receptor [Pristionchus pacificus]